MCSLAFEVGDLIHHSRNCCTKKKISRTQLNSKQIKKPRFLSSFVNMKASNLIYLTSKVVLSISILELYIYLSNWGFEGLRIWSTHNLRLQGQISCQLSYAHFYNFSTLIVHISPNIQIIKSTFKLKALSICEHNNEIKTLKNVEA